MIRILIFLWKVLKVEADRSFITQDIFDSKILTKDRKKMKGRKTSPFKAISENDKSFHFFEMCY